LIFLYNCIQIQQCKSPYYGCKADSSLPAPQHLI